MKQFLKLLLDYLLTPNISQYFFDCHYMQIFSNIYSVKYQIWWCFLFYTTTVYSFSNLYIDTSALRRHKCFPLNSFHSFLGTTKEISSFIKHYNFIFCFFSVTTTLRHLDWVFLWIQDVLYVWQSLFNFVIVISNILSVTKLFLMMDS